MTPNTLAVFVMMKQAGPTYDYAGSKRNYFIPAAPKEKPAVVQEGNRGQKYLVKEKPAKGNEFASWGTNSPVRDNSFPLSKFYLHSFEPTVSGTGNGPRFWQQPHNPYE